jgi:hypothetical protein
MTLTPEQRQQAGRDELEVLRQQALGGPIAHLTPDAQARIAELGQRWVSVRKTGGDADTDAGQPGAIPREYMSRVMRGLDITAEPDREAGQ